MLVRHLIKALLTARKYFYVILILLPPVVKRKHLRDCKCGEQLIYRKIESVFACVAQASGSDLTRFIRITQQAIVTFIKTSEKLEYTKP